MITNFFSEFLHPSPNLFYEKSNEYAARVNKLLDDCRNNLTGYDEISSIKSKPIVFTAYRYFDDKSFDHVFSINYVTKERGKGLNQEIMDIAKYFKNAHPNFDEFFDVIEIAAYKSKPVSDEALIIIKRFKVEIIDL